jgi:hypothetical protein
VGYEVPACRQRQQRVRRIILMSEAYKRMRGSDDGEYTKWFNTAEQCRKAQQKQVGTTLQACPCRASQLQLHTVGRGVVDPCWRHQQLRGHPCTVTRPQARTLELTFAACTELGL